MARISYLFGLMKSERGIEVVAVLSFSRSISASECSVFLIEAGFSDTSNRLKSFLKIGIMVSGRFKVTMTLGRPFEKARHASLLVVCVIVNY